MTFLLPKCSNTLIAVCCSFYNRAVQTGFELFCKLFKISHILTHCCWQEISETALRIAYLISVILAISLFPLEVHRRGRPLGVRALQGWEDEERDVGRLLPHAEEWVRISEKSEIVWN